MILWGYAVCRAGSLPPPTAPGVAGDAVGFVADAGLALACSAAPADHPTPPPVERALAFARVVDELHRGGTVVPLRYGSAAGTGDDLRGLLRRRADALAALLADLDGQEEWTVRVEQPAGDAPAPPAPPATGAAYLRARRELYARLDAARAAGERLEEQVRLALAGVVDRAEADAPAGGGRAVVLQLLARRGRAGDLRARVAALPGPARLTGPFPPYHFARLDP